jgi:hypothetical protein
MQVYDEVKISATRNEIIPHSGRLLYLYMLSIRLLALFLVTSRRPSPLITLSNLAVAKYVEKVARPQYSSQTSPESVSASVSTILPSA